MIQQKFVERSRNFPPGYLEGYHHCVETIQTIMTTPSDFISIFEKFREPAANTAKDSRETSAEVSEQIKKDFVSEQTGWDLCFSDKHKEAIKQLMPQTKAEQDCQKIDEYFRDILSEYLVCPNCVSPKLFYLAILEAVKHEYEYYNNHAQNLSKLYDLLSGERDS